MTELKPCPFCGGEADNRGNHFLMIALINLNRRVEQND